MVYKEIYEHVTENMLVKAGNYDEFYKRTSHKKNFLKKRYISRNMFIFLDIPILCRTDI